MTVGLNQFELDLFNTAVRVLDYEETWPGAKQYLLRFCIMAVSREVIKNGGMPSPMGCDIRAETREETEARVHGKLPRLGSDVYAIELNPKHVRDKQWKALAEMNAKEEDTAADTAGEEWKMPASLADRMKWQKPGLD